MAIFKNVADLLEVIIGQLILILDALILVGEFVYLTYLRAKEF